MYIYICLFTFIFTKKLKPLVVSQPKALDGRPTNFASFIARDERKVSKQTYGDVIRIFLYIL